MNNFLGENGVCLLLGHLVGSCIDTIGVWRGLAFIIGFPVLLQVRELAMAEKRKKEKNA